MNYPNSTPHDVEKVFDALLEQTGDNPELHLAVIEALVCAVESNLQANDTYVRYKALCRRVKQMHEDLALVELLAGEIGDQAIVDLAAHAKHLLR